MDPKKAVVWGSTERGDVLLGLTFLFLPSFKYHFVFLSLFASFERTLLDINSCASCPTFKSSKKEMKSMNHKKYTKMTRGLVFGQIATKSHAHVVDGASG